MKYLRAYNILISLIWIILLSSCAVDNTPASTSSTGAVSGITEQAESASGSDNLQSTSSWLVLPMTEALSRVTKKLFWTWITPASSPVSPERFKGYHTWADFETFASEQESDVVVQAICAGPLMLKKWATGYGWVAVQKCQIEGQDMTVVYGHLRLESITSSVDSVIWAWEHLGVLGKGFSQETDGERKHLHLSIHRWSVVNIRGYASTRQELKGWVDPMEYLPK